MSSLETWYAVVDDLIGGWAVATRDCPASELVVGEGSPDREVACFVREEDAREIARLHNAACGRSASRGPGV